MESLLRLMATVAIVSSALPVRRMRVVLRGTTLVAAGRWGTAAWTAWTIAWLATEVLAVAREGAADQIWYAVAVLTVCPFAAVLGARSPQTRVWSWFVVLPLLIVLLLPAITAWNRELSVARLHLEPPMLAGYGLVLLMGTGNYLGTRFGWYSPLAAVACCCVVVPMSSLGERFPLAAESARAVATFVLAAAIWCAAGRSALDPSLSTNGFDRLWIEFRDLFGVVWARRVLERVNEAARGGNWPVRLHLDGFAPADSASASDVTPEQRTTIEQTLRWLLRRFVASEWIDARIGEPFSTAAPK